MVCQRSNGVSPKLVAQIENKVEQLRDIYKNQNFKTVIMSNQTHAIFYHDPRILITNNPTPTTSPIPQTTATPTNNKTTATPMNIATQPTNNISSSPPPPLSPIKKSPTSTSPNGGNFGSGTNLASHFGLTLQQQSMSGSSPASPTTASTTVLAETTPTTLNNSMGFVVGSIEDLSQRLHQYLDSVNNFVKLFSEDESQQFINQGIYHIRSGGASSTTSNANNPNNISNGGNVPMMSTNSNLGASSSTPILICSIFVKTDITCAIFVDVFDQDATVITEDMDDEILNIVEQLQLLLKSAIEKEKTMVKKK